MPAKTRTKAPSKAKVQESKPATATFDVTVPDTRPAPAEAWQMMHRFSGPNNTEQAAMRQTVDVLFQNGYDLVVGTYDHLQRVPETAEILGWENGADEEHLAERRRFFTIWLARTLSMDFGTDFAQVLFKAGQIHAAHGPRHIHTPSIWITGSIGLVIGTFADMIQKAHKDVAIVAPALAGWNKYLLIQLNQMQHGYDVALDLDRGTESITVKAFSMVRYHWQRESLTARFIPGEPVVNVLRKILDYAPKLRDIMFDIQWNETEGQTNPLWTTVKPIYKLKHGWRVLLNGKELFHHGGFQTPLQSGDSISLFSPGR